MERLKNLFRGLRTPATVSLQTLDASLPEYPMRKHWWSGIAGGVMEGEDVCGQAMLVKYWRHGAEEADEIQSLAENRVRGADVVPVVRWELQGKLLMALQPLTGTALPSDPVLVRRFSPQDTDNRLELAIELCALLVRLEVAGLLPRHFVAWQFWRLPDERWVLDTLGAPYPGTRLHRALTRQGVDDMHLLPWPAPPDVLTRRQEPAATAVWCLGHLIFELLTGQPPFGHADDTLSGMSMLLEGAPSVRSLNPQVSRTLDRLIRRMLAGDPTLRPGSISEVASGLHSS